LNRRLGRALRDAADVMAALILGDVDEVDEEVEEEGPDAVR
jgi:hypothetical protein